MTSTELTSTELTSAESADCTAGAVIDPGGGWTSVCRVSQVRPDRGVAALVEGDAVAIFRLSPATADGHDEWRAVSHIDPVSGAPIIARGLVGSVGEGPIVIPTVASPLHKQRYNLRTGYCLDDDSLRLETYEVRVVGDAVECRPRLDR